MLAANALADAARLADAEKLFADALAELFPEIEPLELAPNAFSTERVSAPGADEPQR